MIFVKVHETLDIILELSAFYDANAYGHFWSTVLFIRENNENIICRPSSQNFENLDFFLQKPNFSTFLVSEMETNNNDFIKI